MAAVVTGGSYDSKAAGGGTQAGSTFVFDQRGLFSGKLINSNAAGADQGIVTTGVILNFDGYTGTSLPIAGTGTAKTTITLPGKESSVVAIQWSVATTTITGADLTTIALRFTGGVATREEIVWQDTLPVAVCVHTGVWIGQLVAGEAVAIKVTAATDSHTTVNKTNSTTPFLGTYLKVEEIAPGRANTSLITF